MLTPNHRMGDNIRYILYRLLLVYYVCVMDNVLSLMVPITYYQDPFVQTQTDSNLCYDCDEDSCEGFLSCLRRLCCINALSNIIGHDFCICGIFSYFSECLDDCYKCIGNCDCGDCNCDDCNADDCDCDDCNADDCNFDFGD